MVLEPEGAATFTSNEEGGVSPSAPAAPAPGCGSDAATAPPNPVRQQLDVRAPTCFETVDDPGMHGASCTVRPEEHTPPSDDDIPVSIPCHCVSSRGSLMLTIRITDTEQIDL